MSSNPHHINPVTITRDNYEEYFLLYVDDELTAAEKAAVEAFTLLHPDLKEELDGLLGTKLPLLDVSLENKQALFADSMKVTAIDESLLLYIDNELPEADKAKVEEKIQQDAAYQLQHQLLLKTKLDAGEKIVYPYKAELYHKTERRIHAYWWRIAAAAVLIIWAGTFNWSSDDDTTGPVALQNNRPAQQQSATKPTTTPATKSAQQTPAAAHKETTPATETTAASSPQASSATQSVIASPVTQPAQNHTIDYAAAVQEPSYTPQPVERVNLQPNGLSASQQIINNAVVTSAVPVRTISTEAHAATPVPVDDAVATIPNEKSGSLKGFLRKTTRFIERTTSINPVNADDELLIGAVSINLK